MKNQVLQGKFDIDHLGSERLIKNLEFRSQQPENLPWRLRKISFGEGFTTCAHTSQRTLWTWYSEMETNRVKRKKELTSSPDKGLEPLTLRLKVWCSADWANRARSDDHWHKITRDIGVYDWHAAKSEKQVRNITFTRVCRAILLVRVCRAFVGTKAHPAVLESEEGEPSVQSGFGALHQGVGAVLVVAFHQQPMFAFQGGEGPDVRVTPASYALETWSGSNEYTESLKNIYFLYLYYLFDFSLWRYTGVNSSHM